MDKSGKMVISGGHRRLLPNGKIALYDENDKCSDCCCFPFTVSPADALAQVGTSTENYRSDEEIMAALEENGRPVFKLKKGKYSVQYKSGYFVMGCGRITTPKGNLIPNFEGYETNDGFGRTRYHLVVAKNKSTSTLDAMNCFSIWTGKPTGTASYLYSGNYNVSYAAPQTMYVNNASDWPTRGFWVRNKTKNDMRYVDFRSGNALYLKAIDWGVMTFKNAQAEIKPGVRIDNAASNPSSTAIVDQVFLESGTWAAKTASGTLHLKKYTGTSLLGSTSSIYSEGNLLFTGNGISTRGFRGHSAVTWSNNDVVEPTSDLDILKLYKERLPVRWNAIPCDFLARQNIRFNANRQELAAVPIRRQSLVRPGWRILARNLFTDELMELGFIDQRSDAGPRLPSAPEPSAPDGRLTDIWLPDGEYEISVLTSSLFWKDAADTSVRTIVVGADAEISPLPTIYNLRSSVQAGATIIQWSAAKSEVEDCLFGVWYSSEPFFEEATNGSDSTQPGGSPICDEPARFPDATVWYSPLMTEYQTSFEQNAPAYVAVAAIRPGNDSEKGKVHELFLNWSNIPPRAPDDVMVLPEALPTFDSEITERTLEEEDMGLVF